MFGIFNYSPLLRLVVFASRMINLRENEVEIKDGIKDGKNCLGIRWMASAIKKWDFVSCCATFWPSNNFFSAHRAEKGRSVKLRNNFQAILMTLILRNILKVYSTWGSKYFWSSSDKEAEFPWWETNFDITRVDFNIWNLFIKRSVTR